MKKYRVKPIELAEANRVVAAWHRHHKPVVGHRFSVQAIDGDGFIVGVAICGRPVARSTDQRNVLEVTRLVTNGAENACSFLYGAVARIAKAIGFESIQTFILDTEPGTTLKAAGWKLVRESAGGPGWQSRFGRKTDQPICRKQKWEKRL